MGAASTPLAASAGGRKASTDHLLPRYPTPPSHPSTSGATLCVVPRHSDAPSSLDPPIRPWSWYRYSLPGVDLRRYHSEFASSALPDLPLVLIEAALMIEAAQAIVAPVIPSYDLAPPSSASSGLPIGPPISGLQAGAVRERFAAALQTCGSVTCTSCTRLRANFANRFRPRAPIASCIEAVVSSGFVWHQQG